MKNTPLKIPLNRFFFSFRFKTRLALISVLITVFSLFGLTSQALAAVSPLSLSLAPKVQFPPQDFTITGARLSLLGSQEEVYGFDIGAIGNMTTQNFAGLAVSGLFNYNKGQTRALGAQLAGVTNINTGKTTVVGLQAALGANYNSAETHVYGLQLALANISGHTTVNGAQIGVYNRARSVRGFQIGVINVTENLSGIQIGLLNFHRKGVFSVAPIINIGF